MRKDQSNLRVLKLSAGRQYQALFDRNHQLAGDCEVEAMDDDVVSFAYGAFEGILEWDNCSIDLLLQHRFGTRSDAWIWD